MVEWQRRRQVNKVVVADAALSFVAVPAHNRFCHVVRYPSAHAAMVKNRPGSRVGQTKLGTASRKAARRQAARQKNGLANKRTIVHEAMRETWDRRQSPAGNLSRVGLCPSVNTLRKSRVAVGRVVEIASVPAPRDSEVLQRLVEEAGLPEKRAKRVVKPGEKLALEKLVRKHGRDWGKMAADLKLNYLQWTPTQLRKKVERMEAILSETDKQDVESGRADCG